MRDQLPHDLVPERVQRSSTAPNPRSISSTGQQRPLPPGGVPLPPALDAEQRFLDGPGPRVCLYLSTPEGVGGTRDATPLVLVHSVNAAASAAELRPLFERYAAVRPVVALDLPGFGQSERGPLDYSPAMMAEAILRTVQYLQGLGFRQPVDLMAVSLSAEFAARAAMAQPHWFHSVALVSPTGLDSVRLEPYAPERTKEKRVLRQVLESPLWTRALYSALTSRASIRYFLKRTWGSMDIDQQLLEYNVVSACQPGARFAPLAFVSGALFTPGIANLYARLPQPVWISHGVRGDFTQYDALSHMRSPETWVVDVFGTGALPYFEVPTLFASRYEAFLRKVEATRDVPQWRSRMARAALASPDVGTGTVRAEIKAACAKLRVLAAQGF